MPRLIGGISPDVWGLFACGGSIPRKGHLLTLLKSALIDGLGAFVAHSPLCSR